MGEDELRKLWKEYFEDLYNIDTQGEAAVQMCALRGFGGVTTLEESQLEEVEVRVRKIKNGEVAGKDKITGEIINGGGDRVVDWIWRLRNMAFESGAVPKVWRYSVIVPLHKDKEERTECKNY